MRALAMILFTLGLTYAYLYPGSQALFEGRRDLVLSDGTDITSVPYLWDHLRQVWEHHPARFFYGAVYAEAGDPEHGYAIWVGWAERFVGLICSYLVPLEQVSAALTFVLILFNVLAMYGLGRARRWPPGIAFALGLIWGFSYYVRARAQVHPSLAGVFHVPLILWGLTLIAGDGRRRAIGLAAILFTLAAMVPHYYVISAAFLAPVFLLFLRPAAGDSWRLNLARAGLSVVPAVLFLGLSLWFKLPSDAGLSAAQAVPETGTTASGELHPYLSWFGARPVDYFTGNLGLSRGPADPNLLKRFVNESVFSTLIGGPGNGNTHERTNGVHWVMWALCLWAVVGSRRVPRVKNALPFVVLGLAALALSLPPAMLGYGPAAWLYRLVPQMRVPSRAGIWVNFAVIAIVGEWLSANFRAFPWSRVRAWPLALIALVVLEDLPFYNLARVAPVGKAFVGVLRAQSSCGAGMDFPYVSNDVAQIPYYQFLSRLRGSDCRDLNSLIDGRVRRRLTEAFPPSENYLRQLDRDVLTPIRLEKLARCVPLSYLAFDPVVPAGFVTRVCTELGWRVEEPGLCLAPKLGVPLAKPVADCL